jgi:hypothetical protein
VQELGVCAPSWRAKHIKLIRAEIMEVLDDFQETFNSVGWFIPPFVPLGFLGLISKEILDKKGKFSQSELEGWLSIIYSPENLSAMVYEKYAITPFINDYKVIIAEAIESHFLGLNHMAVSGLMPVIEGAGKKISKHRKVKWSSIKSVFINLAEDCKSDVTKNNIGAVGEIISMMNSFIEYTGKHLYIDSNQYVLPDKTNRHGILHGAYTDTDYGVPINFFKSIAAIDFLSFISALNASISWLAPTPTKKSLDLCTYYKACLVFSKNNSNHACNIKLNSSIN